MHTSLELLYLPLFHCYYDVTTLTPSNTFVLKFTIDL